MKIIILMLLLICLPVLSLAEDGTEPPHWSLELKGGAFSPQLAGWSRYYGGGYPAQYGGALSYKIVRQLELGLEGSYLRASGKGQQPLHAAAGDQVPAGAVTYEQLPLDVFVLARGIFREDQLLVPYLGGGWTRLFYREAIQGEGKQQGSTNGYHARGGIQFLLDSLDRDAARNLDRDFQVRHSYFFTEAKYTHAAAGTDPSGSVNLGGISYLGGLLFEF